MSLDVEMECLQEHWYAGTLMKVGDVYSVPPSRALKLIQRGNAKKVGVVESGRVEESVEVEAEEVVEAESEEYEENESFDEDDT